MESQPQNLEFRNNPENIHPCKQCMKTYITLRVQESPASCVKETFWIICDCFHDLRPVQALHTFSIPDITGTENI